MIYLNFTDLSEEAQERLLAKSKEDVKKKYGRELMNYALKHHTPIDQMLDEEAMRHLYFYIYVFNIKKLKTHNQNASQNGAFFCFEILKIHKITYL